MKKFLGSFLYVVTFAASMMLSFASCSKTVTDEADVDNNAVAVSDADGSTLRVVTRSSAGDVTYPVKVYVFNSSNACVATQTIASASETLSFTLKPGSYDVLAIGDADEERYTIPSQEEATKDFVIQTREGKVLDDVMTASSTVVLEKDVANSLTLNMVRKVWKMNSVTIKKVPTTATAVSLTIRPLYESVMLNGEYSGSAGSYTVELAKQDDTTWRVEPTDAYQYPSSDNAIFTVTITDGATTAYTYNSNEAIPANYKLVVEGTYTGNGVELSGTINGVEWQGTKTITFEFDKDSASGSSSTSDQSGSGESGGESGSGESGSGESGGESGSGNNGQNVSGTVPEVGATYEGCYVLAVDGNEVTILSPVEQEISSSTSQSVVNNAINEALGNWNVTGVNATWRLPTESEANAIFEAWKNDDSVCNMEASKFYYYDCGNGNCGVFKTSSNATFQHYPELRAAPTKLLPVTTLTFEE